MSTQKNTIAGFLLCMLTFVTGSSAQGDSGIVSITSNIAGTNVYCDSSFIGNTPLSDIVLSRGRHTIMVIDGTPFQWDARREEREIHIERDTPILLRIEFSADSMARGTPGDAVRQNILIHPKKFEFHPLLVTGGVVAIASGIATAYCKIRADARYDKFLATGDSEFLQETHRYDTMAAITLALSQIGLAIVAYCFLSE
jgi:hypothetical protein